MKILLVGPASPMRGGIANFNDSLYSALVKYHDAHIIGFSLQYPSLLFPGRTQYESGAANTGTGSRHLINSINPLSWRTTAAEIVKIRPECIVVHYWMPFFAPSLGIIIRNVKKRSNIPVIALLHNVEPHEGMVAGRSLNRYFFKSCDGFITMSSTVLADLRKAGINKPSRLVYHPVYDIFGEPLERRAACENLGLDPGIKYLLFFGIIRSYKGLDLMLRVMSNRRIEHLNLKLLVAGEFYENDKRYRDMVDELGIGNRVMFTGSYVPKEDVAFYFSASDLVVLPYLSATQSGVTQIAYHFDKPMLVTNVGGLKDMVAHGRVGYVCEKDPDEIASAIADFFENDRSDEFTANIRIEKKKFSWFSFVKELEGLAGELGYRPPGDL